MPMNPLFVNYGAGQSGIYNLSSSGLVTATWEYVGDNGTGIFTQSGGTNTVTNTLTIGNVSGGTGTYNLNGGLLIVSALTKGSGTATFNFNGGVLQAGSTLSSSLPMTLGTGGGGATVNTPGFAVTLSGSLSGPGSLTKIGSGVLTLTASNTYSGNTLISGGTLALGSSLALQDSCKKCIRSRRACSAITG